jgi:hypothetical protein
VVGQLEGAHAPVTADVESEFSSMLDEYVHEPRRELYKHFKCNKDTPQFITVAVEGGDLGESSIGKASQKILNELGKRPSGKYKRHDNEIHNGWPVYLHEVRQ